MYLSKAPSGHYHVRMRVPSDCQPLIQRTEMHVSLKTKSRREAERLAAPIITSMRAQIIKAKAAINRDSYRAEVLRAQIASLNPFDAIDRHFERTHPRHTLEQLEQHVDQIMAPDLHPPADPARTVIEAFGALTPLYAVLEHNKNAPIGEAAIAQRGSTFEEFMAHQHAEGRHYLEHVTPEHWQQWARSLFDGKIKHSYAGIKQSRVRSVIRDFLIDHARPYTATDWSTIKVGRPTRDELVGRREANSPVTLERWQEVYDKLIDINELGAADMWALGLLTGARIRELANMAPDQINFDANEWRIPETVAKTVASVRMIPLTPLAQAIIHSRPLLDGLYFAGIPHDFDNNSARWRVACTRAREKVGCTPYVETQHSTRSTFRTLAPRMAPNTPDGVIEAIVGHEIKGGMAAVTKHYLRAFEPDAHIFMASWRPAIRIRQQRS